MQLCGTHRWALYSVSVFSDTFRLATHDFSCREAERHLKLGRSRCISDLSPMCSSLFCCWLFAIFLKIIIPSRERAEEYEKAWYWDQSNLLFGSNRSWWGRSETRDGDASLLARLGHHTGWVRPHKWNALSREGASRVCLLSLIVEYGQTGHTHVCLVRAATQTPARTWCPCGLIPVVCKAFFY